MSWRAVPILVTHNPARTLAFYQRLGFELRGHTRTPGAQYLLLARDGIEIHFTEVPANHVGALDSAVYVYVEDAVALHRTWATLGLPVTGVPRLMAPKIQPWGHMEGHLLDPDGHLLRYGSPLPPRAD